jgi:hypothetical protein
MSPKLTKNSNSLSTANFNARANSVMRNNHERKSLDVERGRHHSSSRQLRSFVSPERKLDQDVDVDSPKSPDAYSPSSLRILKSRDRSANRRSMAELSE